jgi:hypothetical protein
LAGIGRIAVPLAAALVMATSAMDGIAADLSTKREIIPGSELMTSQERERYRERMRRAKTPDEEEKIRAEHTNQMRERARVRGLRLAELAGKSEAFK